MQVRVILVPYDSGHLRKRMGIGPERVLEAGLKGLLTRLGIQYQIEQVSLESPYPAEISAAFELCRKVAIQVRDCRQQGIFPVVLSGNCGIALGTVSGYGASEAGIVWFDAHGEATTPETTASGFLDGMPIATLLGRAWQGLAKTVPGFVPIPGNRIVLFGARALEPAELSLLEAAGVIQAATTDQLNKKLPRILKEVKELYLHVDLDVLDPNVATANQWTPPGGITVECLLSAITEVGTQAKIGALGIASYDPATDRNGRGLAAAVSVAETVLGHG
jgi:arginase